MSGTLPRLTDNWYELLSTELNALLAGAGAQQSVAAPLNNVNGFPAADFEFVITFVTAPTSGTLDVFLLALGSDGATYEDGAGGTSPVTNIGNYNGTSLLPRAVTTVQRVILKDQEFPGQQVKALLINNTNAEVASGTLSVRRQGSQYT